MRTDEIEVLKDLVANIDYYLAKGDLARVNRELNNTCEYILMKEGYIKHSNLIQPELLDTNANILSDYIYKSKPAVNFVRNEKPTEKIPHTKYEFYKKKYVSS